MSPVSILVLMDLCIKTEIPAKMVHFERSFNPCFNGSMYKNLGEVMLPNITPMSFNPCFNGSMYKNEKSGYYNVISALVSILVLMDLCIKTSRFVICRLILLLFQSLF